jgi:choline dehydrogenase
MLPFYKKTTTSTPGQNARAANASANYTSPAYNSTDGPLQVSFLGFSPVLGGYGPAAYDPAGMLPTTGFSSGVLNGYGYFPFTVDPNTGTRSFAETSLLSLTLGNPQLTLCINSQAMKVVFDGNKTATGVMVKQPRLNPYVMARVWKSYCQLEP